MLESMSLLVFKPEQYCCSRLFGPVTEITYRKKFNFQAVINSKLIQILINIQLFVVNINRHSLLYSENEVYALSCPYPPIRTVITFQKIFDLHATYCGDHELEGYASVYLYSFRW
jgi:hypothetical protein